MFVASVISWYPQKGRRRRVTSVKRLGTLSGSLRPRNKILMREKHELPKTPAALASLRLISTP